MLYPVAILQKDSEYVVTVPDIPELNVVETTIADAIASTRLAIMAHVAHLMMAGAQIPEARDLSAYLKEPKFLGVTWAIIALDTLIAKQSTAPHQLMLPPDMMELMYQKLRTSDKKGIEVFILKTIFEKLATL